MKFNLFKSYPTYTKFRFIMLAGLLSGSLMIGNSCHALSKNQENKLCNFLKEFLDTKRNPNKAFKDWAGDLIKLLKGDKKFAPFCSELNRLQVSRNLNPKIVGLKFKQYERLMPKKVKNSFKDKTKDQLLAIFAQRIKATGQEQSRSANNRSNR